MTIEEALRAYFLADPTLVADIGSRFYPIALVQNAQYPAVAYQKISGVEGLSHSGSNGHMIPRYQLTLWDTNYPRFIRVTNNLRKRIRFYGRNKALFSGNLSGIVVDNLWVAGDLEDRDPESKELKRFLDFFIAYTDPP